MLALAAEMEAVGVEENLGAAKMAAMAEEGRGKKDVLSPKKRLHHVGRTVAALY